MQKALLIDENFLIQLKEIYSIIEQEPIFTLFTRDGAKYQFTSLDDFEKYYFDEEIECLLIENSQNGTNNILFKFHVTPHYIWNYNFTSICIYSVKNNSLDSILKEKILKLYKNHVKSDWLLGKLSWLFLSLNVCLLIIFIFNIKHIQNLSFLSEPINYIFIIGIFVGFYLSFIIKIIDKFICNKFFKPLVYYLGLQKNKWDNTLKLRDNIFWVIIVGIFISLVTPFIAKLLLIKI